MANIACTPSTVADAGATLAPLSNDDKYGILLYVLAKWLSVIGGTNYTADFSQLVLAAKLWPDLNPAQQQAGLIQIVRAVAVSNGASIPTSNSDLVAAANYLINTPNKDAIALFLACAIGTQLD